MIRSFRSKPLQQFADTGNSGKLPVHGAAVDRTRRVLLALDAASRPEDMNIPGYHFHSLTGVARWSVRVTANWRITFGWHGADAIDVDLEDYH